jgi:hypothetical protein
MSEDFDYEVCDGYDQAQDLDPYWEDRMEQELGYDYGYEDFLSGEDEDEVLRDQKHWDFPPDARGIF